MAIYDSLESLPCLTLHLHTYSNSLSVQIAKILAILLFGTEALQAELGLGFTTCSCSQFFSFSPWSVLGALEGGGESKLEVSSMHRAGREGRGGEMQGILPEAKALPGFRATHSSTSEKSQVLQTGGMSK